MTRRIFTGALSDEIAQAEGQAGVRERVSLLHQAAKGMLDLIRDGLIRDGAVRLHHFGTFRLKPVAARKGINPRTGAPLVIAAHRRVIFTPAKALLDRIEPIHPIPVPLPAAESSAPVVAAIAATPPIAPTEIPPALEAERVIDSPTPEAPTTNRRPERRWMAAVALFAALAVLVILLLPSDDERPITSVAVTQAPPAPQQVAPSATTPHRDAPDTVAATATPPSETLHSAPLPAAEPPVAVARTDALPQLPATLAEERHADAATLDGTAATAGEAPQRFAPPLEQPQPVARETHTTQRAVTVQTPSPLARTAIGEPPMESAPVASAAIEATVETADKAAAPVTPSIPSSTTQQPFFSERSYAVSAGDSLWRLSNRYYEEPILWPHIYRANHPRVGNPNLIYIGDLLTLPELQGSPAELSATDRQRIAEGYYLVYQFYDAQRHPDAIYALIGARWFDPAVYERHRDDLSRQRLRIMELSPLHGDSVPRLLAATFNRPTR